MIQKQFDLPPDLMVNEVAHRCRTHPSAVRRWIDRGVILADGTRCRLEAYRLPGGWRIRPEDLAAFQRALTNNARPIEQGRDLNGTQTPRVRARQSVGHLAAKAQAKALGLL